MPSLPRSAETIGTVAAPPAVLFAFLDDHQNLSAHMSESSWMMLGSKMDIHVDAGKARAVGSRFGFKGAILGISLAVDEVVVAHEPPQRKVWDTFGEPRLWVIGAYRMGFEITPLAGSSRLRVFISYALPQAGIPRFLGFLLGGAYAKWCTSRMVGDARGHFSVPVPTALNRAH
jgi:hypothetical protein